MDYQKVFEEQSEYLIERMNLARERIAQMEIEGDAQYPYRSYFQEVAKYVGVIFQIFDDKLNGNDTSFTLAQLRTINEALYREVLPGEEGYETSFLNPAYAVKELGEAFGGLLSFLYAEMRGLVTYVYEGRFEELMIFCELFVQVYGYFEREEEPEEALVRGVLHDFYLDYSELFSLYSVRALVDPSMDFWRLFITQSDLSDLRYLYASGEYISESELRMAQFLNTLPEEEVRSMADTFVEGYRKGFELAGIDLSKKKTVSVEGFLGFERMMRYAIEGFEKLGLQPVIRSFSATAFLRRGTIRRGYGSLCPNDQYVYDHRNDQAYYLDQAIVNRRLETLRAAYEQYKTQAAEYAGPAVLEVFGQTPFEPADKPEVLKFSEKQQKLNVSFMNESGALTNEYIHGDERSFTIIAYPVPAIGEQFEDIFRETVKINTLDYAKYQRIQQALIDALDQGTHVIVKGKDDNRTDMTVQLYHLNDPSRETIFENCVADVNIPVGEVFTSPVLEGTNGTLHVSGVYLNELYYKDLCVTIKDGYVTDYTCANFDDPAEGKRYFKSNVLYDHETLPLGEFAIGTNTTAYRMAREYQIADKLPILIAEKTGPHFALGDTCYSHQEDMVTKNPDGKCIVARDNSASIKRMTDLKAAYFNCHTDITLPFDELALIRVIRPDGEGTDLIRDGRFVLPGTEELNEPLEQ